MSTSVSFDIAKHPAKDTIKLLTSLLEKVTMANDQAHSSITSTTDPTDHSRQGRARSASHPSPYTCFHARSIPSISIHAYLIRILKYCPCSNECFLALLVYFDRMSKPNPSNTPSLRLDSYNVHRLVITGIMISSKLFSDVFFTNSRYAKVGGLPVSELNVLELEFLQLNNYGMFVAIDELQYYGDQLLLHWVREMEGNGKAQHSTSDGQANPQDNQPKKQPVESESTNHINTAARHLSIDRGVPVDHSSEKSDLGSREQTKEHPKPMSDNSYQRDQSQRMAYKSNPLQNSTKDIHRKSNEIDRHRVFKRPSFSTSPSTRPRSGSLSDPKPRSTMDRTTTTHILPTPPGSSSPLINRSHASPSPSSSQESHAVHNR
ncbi:cyclin-domain-containing protein [Phycomyces nitens]|nr:cyclin-domain-containing protein [Phycomyces nitens]